MQNLVDRLYSTGTLRRQPISANNVTFFQGEDGIDTVLWTAVNGQVRQSVPSKALPGGAPVLLLEGKSDSVEQSSHLYRV
jgi:hypothetical protein